MLRLWSKAHPNLPNASRILLAARLWNVEFGILSAANAEQGSARTEKQRRACQVREGEVAFRSEFMIQTEAQLQQALEQIENLCRAVQSLRAEVFPKNPRNFAILAEGPVDEIRKLQADVDDYLTRLEGVPAGAAS
jgi:hypothetical protein